MPACTRGDQRGLRWVLIFLALKACRRRLPFTDPFKRGIGASYVVPLYARRNDTSTSKDAWSIWNPAYSWLSDLSCNFGLANRSEWRIWCVTSSNFTRQSCMLIWEFERNR